MELYQLRFFKAVAESKTLTDATEIVHVTQPSLSRAVKKLEEEYGVELFDRVGRNLVLNDNGRVVLEAANRVLDAADAVEPALHRFINERSSVLNVFAPFPLGDETSIISGFRKLHPDIHVRFARSRGIFFGTDAPDLKFFSSFKTYEDYAMVGSERVVAILPKGHPLADQKSVSMRDLANEDLVTVLPSQMRSIMDQVFAKLGIEPHIVLEDQHCQHMCNYVAAGLGISIGSDITWFDAGQYDLVDLVPIEEFEEPRTMYLQKQGASPWPLAAKLFRDYLADTYADLRVKLDNQYGLA